MQWHWRVEALGMKDIYERLIEVAAEISIGNDDDLKLRSLLLEAAQDIHTMRVKLESIRIVANQGVTFETRT